MAIGTSDSFIRQYRFPRLWNIRLYIALRPVVLRWRSLLRSLFGRRASTMRVSGPILNTPLIESREATYKNGLWTAVEGFLDKDFHRKLVSDWPNRFYLAPPSSILKGYDTGFRWVKGTTKSEDIEAFPYIHALYDTFHSAEFSKLLTDVVGSAKPLVHNSFLVITSHPGSFVVPHKDDPTPGVDRFINIVLLVEGTGGKNSGALILARDNQLKDVMYEPPSVTNIALIYDAHADFYHGFPPIAWGKYRYAITASFVDRP